MCKVCGGMAENLKFHGYLPGLLLRVGGRCRFKVELAPSESFQFCSQSSTLALISARRVAGAWSVLLGMLARLGDASERVECPQNSARN